MMRELTHLGWGMVKVGYEAQSFLSANGGLGKGLQLRNLLGPFASEFTGFASNEPNHSGLTFIQEGASGYNAWQQFSLPRSLRRHGIGVYLAPENIAPFFLPRSVRLILVLHDTILFDGYRQQGAKLRLMDAYRRLQIPPSVRRAEIVITVSEFSRQQILRRWPRAQVEVIPCSIPEPWYVSSRESAREDYLLLVTSPAPHKNAEGALSGYSRYAASHSSPLPLRVIGLRKHQERYRPQLQQLGVEHLVHFEPFLTEEELRNLYRAARSVIIPSFAEGFGIPLLEAMACGAPVLCSNTTSLPEVGADAPFYFNPHQPLELSSALEKLLDDSALLYRMSAAGRERARSYHPTVVGAQVARFWERILSPQKTL